MFKDVVLGDGGTDGTADTVKLPATWRVHDRGDRLHRASGAIVQALKVTDNGGLSTTAPACWSHAPRTASTCSSASKGDIRRSDDIADPDAAGSGSQRGSRGHDDDDGTQVSRYFQDIFVHQQQRQRGTWTNAWTETGDNNAPGSGQIQIDAGGGGGTNQLRLLDNGDGASIPRALDLTGRTTATLSFDYSENSFDGNPENVVASFSFNGGTTWHVLPLTLTVAQMAAAITRSNFPTCWASASHSANNIVKFEAFTSNGGDGYIAIDNLNVSTTVTTTTNVAGTPGSGDATTFTENGARVAIASFPAIADDSATMASAKVVLTNAIAGDTLRIGNSNATSGTISIPGPDIAYAIDTSVAGVITLTFSGTATPPSTRAPSSKSATSAPRRTRPRTIRTRPAR